jgi:hypothetical protein
MSKVVAEGNRPFSTFFCVERVNEEVGCLCSGVTGYDDHLVPFNLWPPFIASFDLFFSLVTEGTN